MKYEVTLEVIDKNTFTFKDAEGVLSDFDDMLIDTGYEEQVDMFFSGDIMLHDLSEEQYEELLAYLKKKSNIIKIRNDLTTVYN